MCSGMASIRMSQHVLGAGKKTLIMSPGFILAAGFATLAVVVWALLVRKYEYVISTHAKTFITLTSFILAAGFANLDDVVCTLMADVAQISYQCVMPHTRMNCVTCMDAACHTQ